MFTPIIVTEDKIIIIIVCVFLLLSDTALVLCLGSCLRIKSALQIRLNLEMLAKRMSQRKLKMNGRDWISPVGVKYTAAIRC